MAIGRRPNVEKLLGRDISLEMEGGKIAVNSDFETSVRGIYAIGDVSARTQLAHVAAAQGTYVVERIAGRPHSIKLEVVPMACMCPFQLCQTVSIRIRRLPPSASRRKLPGKKD